MRTGSLQSLISCLMIAFGKLEVSVPPAEMEELAATIYQAMNVEGRVFHTLEHAFSLWDGENPVQGLAALFHDIIYFQVEGGLSAEIHRAIAAYLDEDEGQISIKMDAAQDARVQMSLEVFGFTPGQKLSASAGLNEFLSALFMIKKLERLVPALPLLQMTVCVEATIPFRDASHFDELAQRVRRVSEQQGLGMDEAAVQHSLQLAVGFANADVANFTYEDVGAFLENTWKLLPEMNAALRSRAIYTIRDYRQALQQTEAFFRWVSAEKVIHRYRDYPPEKEYQHRIQRVQYNLKTGREYLQVKLVAIALIEALAELTGGDASLPLFMGDMPDEGVQFRRIEDHLPKPRAEVPEGHLADVQRLLAEGRSGESEFDTRRSLLSLFIYQNLSQAELLAALEQAHALFAGQIAPEQFLRSLNHKVVSVIARACAAMVATRREALLQISRGVYGSSPRDLSE